MENQITEVAELNLSSGDFYENLIFDGSPEELLDAIQDHYAVHFFRDGEIVTVFCKHIVAFTYLEDDEDGDIDEEPEKNPQRGRQDNEKKEIHEGSSVGPNVVNLSQKRKQKAKAFSVGLDDLVYGLTAAIAQMNINLPHSKIAEAVNKMSNASYRALELIRESDGDDEDYDEEEVVYVILGAAMYILENNHYDLSDKSHEALLSQLMALIFSE